MKKLNLKNFIEVFLVYNSRIKIFPDILFSQIDNPEQY